MRFLLFALALVLAVQLPPLEARSEEACVFVEVRGQGPSCRTDDGWLVRLRDGRTVATHGPDPPPPEPGLEALAHPVPPPCVGDPAVEPHHFIVYAVPSDKTDRYASFVGPLRDLVAAANGHLRHEGAEFGVQPDYPFRCAGGVVEVGHAVLATPESQDSFSTIASDLIDLGFDDALAKYWVYYDDDLEGVPYAGQGEWRRDDRLDPLNANNRGPMYAISYAYLHVGVMMHENGHTMGAVQDTSPNSSGAAHCNDGRDVMCYADGGPTSAYSASVCTDRDHFDCNHDDYFHAAPPQVSYLWDHWNIASPVNDWVRVAGACQLRREGVIVAGAFGQPAADGVASRTESAIPGNCAGRRFVLDGGLQAVGVRLGALADFDLCWLDAAGAELACHEATGRDVGVVPAGADQARIRLHLGASGGYRLFAS